MDGNGGRSGGATGRQLDSIVDEARAEVTIVLKMKGKHANTANQSYLLAGKVYLHSFVFRSGSSEPADCMHSFERHLPPRPRTTPYQVGASKIGNP